MQKKLATLGDAVEVIQDGCHLALGGFAITRCAIALAHELIRRGRRKLTLSQGMGAMETDLLVAGGVVSRLLYSGGSLDRFGLLASVNRAIAQGAIEIEEYSGLSMTLRYLAGALGISYIPCNLLLGSDILANLLKRAPESVKEGSCPFTGEKQVLMRALQPEVGVVVANYADSDGNAVITGPLWSIREMAHASRTVIVLAEKIVSTEIMRNNPEKTVIPGAIVNMVVEVPWAAHPTALYQCYDYDAVHLKEYAAANQTPAGIQDYLGRYVTGTTCHEEYLERVGLGRLLKLAPDPYKGY